MWLKNRYQMLPLARILPLLFLVSSLYTQPTEISGIINEYAKVLSIDLGACQSRIEVDSAILFTAGDQVLIIQMKGAEIITSNTENFGTVLDMGSAGHYEFASVASIDDNQIILNEVLNRSYEPENLVQLVKVPVYQNAIVTDLLTARPWDGNKGGILALDVENDLRLEAFLSVNGLGFRGGQLSTQTYTVNIDQDCGQTDYALPAGGTNGGEKGEGIVQSMAAFVVGRGPLANGGGGGNSHNAGGGGGSSFGAGGMGGNEWSSCPGQQAVGGLGGRGLSLEQIEGRLLFGGGGGAGESNGQQGTSGGNGGGILVVLAGSISGDNPTLSLTADGRSVTEDAGPDGAGGGGAGGTILLSVSGTIGETVFATVIGGNGGDNANLSSCVGPGGGGGGGIMLFAGNTPNIPVDLMLGFAGAFTSPNLPCSNTTYGAAPGVNGIALSDVDIFYATPGQVVEDDFLGRDTLICSGSDLLLNASMPDATAYAWQDGSTESTFLVSTPGTYSVTVILGECTVQDDIRVDFSIDTFSILARPDTFLCDDLVELRLSQDFAEYLWSDGSTEATLDATRIGAFSVTVTDENGCMADASITIADCGGYAIPNVFTPNGDGTNDLFGVFFTGDVTVLSLRIYNRWGNLVHDRPEKWDGNYEGEPHPSGVLIYQAIIETADGVVEEKGEVTLLR